MIVDPYVFLPCVGMDAWGCDPLDPAPGSLAPRETPPLRLQAPEGIACPFIGGTCPVP